MIRLLTMFRRNPVRPAKPETDWQEMGCEESCRHMHSVLPGCAYAAEPLAEDEEEYRWTPNRLWGYEKGQTNRGERLVLDQLSELAVCGWSSWDAARVVFGGTAVIREASRAALSATVSGVRRDSVPR